MTVPLPATLPGLEGPVNNFDRNPAENRKLIRHMMEVDGERFYRSAIEILSGQADSRGTQYLVALLVSHDLLVRILCDPALSREQATRIARSAIRVDSLADIKLARKLADDFEEGSGSIPLDHAVRLLDILNDVSNGVRLLPSLVRIIRHPDPHLRSKAVLLVGRANRSGRWASDRQTDADPRIRANAIEGLWGVASDAAREMLRAAASDSNNRVAGNALLGLYQLGESSAIAETLAMATHDSAIFRSTAAWIMGESGDPRFKETLAAMLREESSVVRRRAFSALRALKAAVPSGEGSGWTVSGRLAAGEGTSLRRIHVAVASDSAHPAAVLLPTNFILNEDGAAVTEYRVVERPAGEALAAIFLFPRVAEDGPFAWSAGALRAAPWKRASDCWATLHYLPESPGSAWNPGQPLEPFRLHTVMDAAAAELSRTPPKTECADIWRVLGRAIMGDCGAFHGKRNIVLFSRSPVQGEAGHELASAIASGGSLQVISTVPDAALESLCRSANGLFQRAASDSHAADLMAQSYLRLLARHEITYRPVSPNAAEIRVRVHHRLGAGETTLRCANP